MNKLRPPRAIGMPWHGLASDWALPAPAPATLGINYWDGGCILVKPPVTHPRAKPRNAAQQADDAATGHSWPDHALLCGQGRSLNGAADAELGQNAWLYCDDAAGTWLLDMVTTKNSGADTITVAIWLRRLFGRLGAGVLPAIDRNLGELTFRPSVLDVPQGPLNSRPATLSYINPFMGPQPTPDGKSAYLNINTREGTGGAAYYELHYGGDGYLMSDLLQIDITGDGSTAAATLGDGISATVTRIKTHGDMNTKTESDTGLVTSGDWVCGSTGTATRTEASHTGTDLFFYYAPSGAQEKLRFQEDFTSSLSAYHSGDPAEVYVNSSINHSGTITIGTHAYPYSTTASFTGEPWDCNLTHAYPDEPAGEQLPVSITWLGVGISGYVRQHSTGDIGEKIVVVGWHGGAAGVADRLGSGGSYRNITDFNASCHPDTAAFSWNIDGPTLCWV